MVVTHGLQCLGRPVEEPVDGGAIDQGWILAEVILELVTGRAHEQEQVKVAFASLGEESVRCILRRVLDLCLFELFLDLVMDFFFVFSGEKRGQFAHVEDVVYILDELLLFDLLVAE